MGRTHLLAAVSAAGLLLAACGGAGDVTVRMAASGASATPSAAREASPAASSKPGHVSLGRGEGAVSVLALSGYVEWGGTDPKVSWVREFEKRTGCRVSLRFYEPPREERPGDFDPSSFDVVVAPPDVAGRLIAERKAAPLDTALLADYDDIPKPLRAPTTVDGKVYGVPYLWGVNEVLYDAERGRPDGREDLFGDDGKVMIKDSPLSIAEAALVLKERGARVKNPFELTPSQLGAAVRLLGEHAGERRYWRDPIEVVEGLAAKSVRLAQGTPYQADVLRRGGRPVRTLGDRPATGWVDAWMLSAKAAHPSCGYRWIDWSSSATVQRKAAAWTGLAPADPDACGGPARDVCRAYQVGEPEAFRGVVFAVRPPDYARWTELWSSLPR